MPGERKQMMNKTQTVSKRAKITILVLFESYTLSFAFVKYVIFGMSETSNESTYGLNLLIFGIFFSLYALALAWFIEPIFRFFAARAKKENHMFSSERWKLVLSYMFLYFPTLFANMLLPMGLPFSQFYYFLGTTVLAAFAWGINDLRKSKVSISHDESNSDQ